MLRALRKMHLTKTSILCELFSSQITNTQFCCLVKICYQLFSIGYNQYNAHGYNFLTMKNITWLTGKVDE